MNASRMQAQPSYDSDARGASVRPKYLSTSNMALYRIIFEYSCRSCRLQASQSILPLALNSWPPLPPQPSPSLSALCSSSLTALCSCSLTALPVTLVHANPAMPLTVFTEEPPWAVSMPLTLLDKHPIYIHCTYRNVAQKVETCMHSACLVWRTYAVTFTHITSHHSRPIPRHIHPTTSPTTSMQSPARAG